ncbi:alpha/beta hydrolase [Bacillus sp. V3-13]|uniref:alpha/beta fold hydrolase n=1 Tax=Bacillus sp. V3-13 TaxID=2053728 RepID=UPI000C756A8A|nr:alpha/beta hydrolase [Bacillus sp. V3-13]PLR79379.1 alpha/beta hydrolase [Bacillus sp. V3-13]
MVPTAAAETKRINGNDVYYEYYRNPQSCETVVLLHGFLSSSFSFRRLVPLLKNDYSVISIDFPPFGKSGKSRNFHYSYQNIALTIVGLLESLNIDKFNIIGHSMGGQITLNMLHFRPGLAEKAVLLCSSGYLSPSKMPLIFSSYLPFFHVFVKRRLEKSGLRNNLENVVHNRSLIDEEMENGYLQPFLDENIFKALTRMIRDREGDLTSNVLRQIETPCLLIWGEHDKVVPLRVGRKLHKDLQHSKLIVLKDTGHLVPEERPAEVYHHIKKFLTG